MIDPVDEVRARYLRFVDEAAGRSRVYQQWAAAVVADQAALATVASLPRGRRQPPLVFAVARLLGAAGDGEALCSLLVHRSAEVAALLHTHSLQTNEPQRCAALLPALATVSGPISLIELGASAGLCLYPDRYAYRYQTSSETIAVAPDEGSAVTLTCSLRGDAIPAFSLPDIVWRAGADLHPLDARRETDRAWLAALVWPGEQGRAERILAAAEIAAADPPHLLAADAIDALPALVANAPAGTTIVVTTPGLLPFLPAPERAALISLIRSLPVRWITLDAPALHPDWNVGQQTADGFVLAVDGDVVGIADPLGAWLQWRIPNVGSWR